MSTVAGSNGFNPLYVESCPAYGGKFVRPLEVYLNDVSLRMKKFGLGPPPRTSQIYVPPSVNQETRVYSQPIYAHKVVFKQSRSESFFQDYMTFSLLTRWNASPTQIHHHHHPLAPQRRTQDEKNEQAMKALGMVAIVVTMVFVGLIGYTAYWTAGDMRKRNEAGDVLQEDQEIETFVNGLKEGEVKACISAVVRAERALFANTALHQTKLVVLDFALIISLGAAALSTTVVACAGIFALGSLFAASAVVAGVCTTVALAVFLTRFIFQHSSTINTQTRKAAMLILNGVKNASVLTHEAPAPSFNTSAGEVIRAAEDAKKVAVESYKRQCEAAYISYNVSAQDYVDQYQSHTYDLPLDLVLSITGY